MFKEADRNCRRRSTSSRRPKTTVIHCSEVPDSDGRTGILEIPRAQYELALSSGLRPILSFPSKEKPLPGLAQGHTRWFGITAADPGDETVIKIRREAVTALDGVMGEFHALVVHAGMSMKLILLCQQQIQAVLLPGGPDLDRSWFEKTQHVSPTYSQDLLELWLAAWAIENDFPVLGICRGMQILAALGGLQVDDMEETTILHTAQPQSYEQLLQKDGHLMQFTAAADRVFTHGIARADRMRVNSMHHQATLGLPNQFRNLLEDYGLPNVKPELLAASADGVWEMLALLKNGQVAALGIQSHPEVGRLANLPDWQWDMFDLIFSTFEEMMEAAQLRRNTTQLPTPAAMHRRALHPQLALQRV